MTRLPRAGGVLACLLLLVAGLAMARVPTASADQRTLLGADMIAPASPNWSAHRALFRQMRGQVVRYRIDSRFGPRPEHIDQLIADGAQVVILATSTPPVYDTVYREFVGAQFWQKVLAHPATQFYLELGNEPELVPVDLWAYRWHLINTYDRLKPQVDVPNLGFLPSMPVTVQGAHVLLDDDAITRRFDGLATHLYGGLQLGDPAGGELAAVYQMALATGEPIWMTEVGIDDRATPKAEKARRILDWVGRQPAQLRGVMAFMIADHGDNGWPQYEVTAEMADVFGQRLAATPTPTPTPPPTSARYFPETGQWLANGFKDYWESRGGLMQFGYPLTEEYREPETGLTIQVFERAVFEYHPEHAGTPYAVLLKHLGREWLSRQP